MSEAAYIFPTEVIRVDYDCSVEIETPIPAGFSSGWAAAREESFSQAAAATVSPHLLRGTWASVTLVTGGWLGQSDKLC